MKEIGAAVVLGKQHPRPRMNRPGMEKKGDIPIATIAGRSRPAPKKRRQTLPLSYSRRSTAMGDACFTRNQPQEPRALGQTSRWHPLVRVAQREPQSMHDSGPRLAGLLPLLAKSANMGLNVDCEGSPHRLGLSLDMIEKVLSRTCPVRLGRFGICRYEAYGPAPE